MSDNTTAVIEVAEASGVTLLSDDQKDPSLTTTFGTGELIKDAIEQGCQRVIIGLGGSATNDWGVGALQALGFSFQDKTGREIGFGCNELAKVEIINTTNRHELLTDIEFLIATDVNSPLLGDDGASYTYALQKGASLETLAQLEQNMSKFNTQVEQYLGCSVASIPGAGAAGGFGAGLLAFLNGKITSGAQLVMENIGFEDLFKTHLIDLVITGEGSIDYQTSRGKLPVAVAQVAKKYSVPVVAIVGKKGDDFEAVFKHGIDAVYSLSDGSIEQEATMRNPAYYLKATARKLMQTLQTSEF